MVGQVVYLLDTNVISEPTKPVPSGEVIEKLKQFELAIALPSLVVHELRFGWLSMNNGRNKDRIGKFVADVLVDIPVLNYDAKSARVHAEIRIALKSKGLSIPFVDGQIAAIAIANGLTLVTRNIKDFQFIPGIRLDNWFDKV